MLGYDAILSYTRDQCENGPPPRACIVNFHGRSKPCDLKTGWAEAGRQIGESAEAEGREMDSPTDHRREALPRFSKTSRLPALGARGMLAVKVLDKHRRAPT